MIPARWAELEPWLDQALEADAAGRDALLGALDGLVSDVPRLPDDLAVLAHRVETVRAGREAGVQDHWAAAVGGAGLVIAEMTDVSRALRARLVDEVAIGRLTIELAQVSVDGTRKLRLRTADNRVMESVLIPDADARSGQSEAAGPPPGLAAGRRAVLARRAFAVALAGHGHRVAARLHVACGDGERVT